MKRIAYTAGVAAVLVASSFVAPAAAADPQNDNGHNCQGVAVSAAATNDQPFGRNVVSGYAQQQLLGDFARLGANCGNN
jgi:uncharacterized membrane protein